MFLYRLCLFLGGQLSLTTSGWGGGSLIRIAHLLTQTCYYWFITYDGKEGICCFLIMLLYFIFCIDYTCTLRAFYCPMVKTVQVPMAIQHIFIHAQMHTCTHSKKTYPELQTLLFWEAQVLHSPRTHCGFSAFASYFGIYPSQCQGSTIQVSHADKSRRILAICVMRNKSRGLPVHRTIHVPSTTLQSRTD